MRRLIGSSLLLRLRRSISLVEVAAVLSAALLVELAYANNPGATDVFDIAFVMGRGAAALMAATLSRYRTLPLTSRLLDAGAALVAGLRGRLVLSLGLDFHPERHPRLPAFTGLRRAILVAALAALVLYPARGLVREVLLLTRVPGLHTVHVVLLGATWLALLAGLAVHVPAIVLGAIEGLKRRAGLRGVARALCIAAFLVPVAMLTAVLGGGRGSGGW